MFLCFITHLGFGQQLPQYSQYLVNDFIFNPAVAGARPAFEMNLGSRYQWEGLSDAPRTYIASAQGPLQNKKVGLGGFVYADVTGPTKRTGFQFAYAYHFKINDNVKLSLAASGGLMQFAVDGGKLNLKNPDDIALSNSYQSAIAPDASAGFYLYSDDFFVSGSVPQILGSSLRFFDDYAKTLSNLSRHYFLSAGYNFGLGNSIKLQPSFLVKYIQPTVQIDATLRLMYEDLIWVGANFRPDDAIGFLMGYTFLENFHVAYAYDYPIGDLQTYSTGSHEFILGFRFNNRAHLKK